MASLAGSAQLHIVGAGDDHVGIGRCDDIIVDLLVESGYGKDTGLAEVPLDTEIEIIGKMLGLLLHRIALGLLLRHSARSRGIQQPRAQRVLQAFLDAATTRSMTGITA